MQNRIFVALVIFTVLVKCSVSERISDRKCEEYSKISRDPARPQPHMVWLRIATKKIVVVGVLGTLISDKFVLTSAVSDIILVNTQAYFVPEEQYNIKEVYTHPFYKRLPHYDIALLRLEVKINLDRFHRPACLWTKKSFDSTTAELVQWDSKIPSNNYKTNTLKIITGNDCTSLHSQINASLFCLKPENSEDVNYIPAPGSPIQVYQPEENLFDNYYIYGIFSFFYYNAEPYVSIGVKIYEHLDWIESVVWGVGNKNCGRLQINEKQKPLLTFAQPTFHGEFPWHAALYRTDGYGSRKFICGGSLLNEVTVLTAAHCVAFSTGTTAPSLLIVSLGKYDLESMGSDTRESHVDKVIPHESFNRQHLENDIAILKLKSVIEYSSFIQPICISNEKAIVDSAISGVVTGWGRNEFDVPSNVLTKATLPIVSNEDCRDSDRKVYPQLLNEKNFCAGHLNGTTVCTGDSGGGFIFERNNQWYIRGIVSLGISLPNSTMCDLTQYAIFTDAVKFIDWITDKL